MTADDLDQAVEDLTAEWSVNRRQRWTIDIDQAAGPVTGRGRTSLGAPLPPSAPLISAPSATPSQPSPDAQRRLDALDVSLRLQRLEADTPPRNRGLGLA